METFSQKVSDPASKTRQELLGRPENSAIQKLLDVVASIIAEEYIQAVRKNPEVFKEAK